MILSPTTAFLVVRAFRGRLLSAVLRRPCEVTKMRFVPTDDILLKVSEGICQYFRRRIVEGDRFESWRGIPEVRKEEGTFFFLFSGRGSKVYLHLGIPGESGGSMVT